MKHSIIIVTFGLVTQLSLLAGAFTNLDFESANTNNITGGDGIYYGTTKDLTPGWKVKDKNGVEKTTIFFNSSTPGGIPFAQLQMKNPDYTSVPFDGQYQFIISSTALDPMFVSQTGTVPSDSKFISFRSINHVSLTIDGTPMQISEKQIWSDDPFNPKSFQFQAWSDISAYAGQDVMLTFGSDVQNMSFGCGFDSVQFVSAVPEPSTIVLFCLGCIGFLMGKSRLSKRAKPII
jgi:hypothetical protein